MKIAHLEGFEKFAVLRLREFFWKIKKWSTIFRFSSTSQGWIFFILPWFFLRIFDEFWGAAEVAALPFQLFLFFSNDNFSYFFKACIAFVSMRCGSWGYLVPSGSGTGEKGCFLYRFGRKKRLGAIAFLPEWCIVKDTTYSNQWLQGHNI